MEIELELKSNSKDVSEVLDKVSQLVKKSQELGFEIDELEIESEGEKREEAEEYPIFWSRINIAIQILLTEINLGTGPFTY